MDEIRKLVETLKWKLRKEICTKYMYCKDCPIKDKYKVDICDAIFLFDGIDFDKNEKK